MIELQNNQLTFRFPKVHKRRCAKSTQRTLRFRMTTEEYPPRVWVDFPWST